MEYDLKVDISDHLATRVIVKALGFCYIGYKENNGNKAEKPATFVVLDDKKYIVSLDGDKVVIIHGDDLDLKDGDFMWLVDDVN